MEIAPLPPQFKAEPRRSVRSNACHIVKLQLSGIVVAALAAMLFHTPWTGFTLFAGGMAYTLPTLLFASLFLKETTQPEQFILLFFIGELAKLISSAALFLLALRQFTLDPVIALIGFIVGIAFFWIASIHHLVKAIKKE